MYCINCGKKIDDTYNYCSGCGSRLDGNYTSNNNDIKKNESGFRIASIILGILSIVCSVTIIFFSYGLIMSIVGFILGLFALKKGKNTLGIVLNIVGFILSIIVLGLFIWLMIWAIDEENDYYGEDYYEEFKDIIDIY